VSLINVRVCVCVCVFWLRAPTVVPQIALAVGVLTVFPQIALATGVITVLLRGFGSFLSATTLKIYTWWHLPSKTLSKIGISGNLLQFGWEVYHFLLPGCFWSFEAPGLLLELPRIPPVLICFVDEHVKMNICICSSMLFALAHYIVLGVHVHISHIYIIIYMCVL